MRSGRPATLLALGAVLAGCGGAGHVGTPAATPPGPRSESAATAAAPPAAPRAAAGARVWGVHLGTPVSGGSLPCGDIDPSGITSTPVADPATGTLDLSNGAVRWERGIDPPGGDYRTEQQRAALALANGRVYVSYGGLYGDCGSYHGWVVGAPTAGPTGPLVSYRVPSHNEGAIWAPSGPAVDRAGDLYVSTGNGSSSSFDYGNAVIRLTPTLRSDGYFAPANAGALNVSDADLGSTGPLLLPGSRVFIMGKSGVAYLLDADALGGLGSGVAMLDVGSAAFGGDAYAGNVKSATTAGLATTVLYWALGGRFAEY
jgi:hypothetical protein